MSILERRLVRWVPLLGGLALAVAACGGSGSDEATPVPSPTPSPAASIEPDVIDGQMALVPAGNDFAVGKGVNFPFVTLSLGGEILEVNDVTARFFKNAIDDPVEVASVTAVKSAPGAGAVFEDVHADGSVHEHGGEEEGRGFFYAKVDLDEAGVWGLVAEGTLPDGTAVTGQMSFQVLEVPAFPAPGDSAIPSDNLTKFDVDDIFTIDSGEVPNDLHEVTIKEAIEAGRPVVIAFATPGFCQTQFCGPVVQEVESLHDDYAADVDFVHIEIWLDITTDTVNPTALEWLAQEDGSFTEPWVYVVDKNGVIFDRWEGPASRVIMEEAVKAVASGVTFNGD